MISKPTEEELQKMLDSEWRQAYYVQKDRCSIAEKLLHRVLEVSGNYDKLPEMRVYILAASALVHLCGPEKNCKLAKYRAEVIEKFELLSK